MRKAENSKKANLLTTTTDDGDNQTDRAEDDEQRTAGDTKISCSAKCHNAQANVKNWQEEALLEEGEPVNIDEEKDNLHDCEEEQNNSAHKGEKEDVGSGVVPPFMLVRGPTRLDAKTPVRCISHDAVSSTSNDSRDRAKDDQNDVDSVWNRHHENELNR